MDLIFEQFFIERRGNLQPSLLNSSSSFKKRNVEKIIQPLYSGIPPSHHDQNGVSFLTFDDETFILLNHVGFFRGAAVIDHGLVGDIGQLEQVEYNPFLLFRTIRKIPIRVPDNSDRLSNLKLTIDTSNVTKDVSNRINKLVRKSQKDFAELINLTMENSPVFLISNETDVDNFIEGGLLSLPYVLRRKFSYTTIPRYVSTGHIKLILLHSNDRKFIPGDGSFNLLDLNDANRTRLKPTNLTSLICNNLRNQDAPQTLIDFYRNYPDINPNQLEEVLSKWSDVENIGDVLPTKLEQPRKKKISQTSSTSLPSRFEKIKELGRGGFAIVYLAHDNILNREVAVKHLVKNESMSLIERFERESRVIAGLDHDNIVRVYDYIQEDDEHYIVMEYISGNVLSKYLKEHGNLSIQEAIQITKGIAEGLAYGHKKGCVHRDVKPANIILFFKKSKIEPKIVDFGLAHVEHDSKLTVTGEVIGTIEYISPEQYRNPGGVDMRSDVYSLGKLFYEMITGESPKDVDHSRVEKLPTSVRNFIETSIRPNPQDRYKSMDDAIEQLDACLASVDEIDHGNNQKSSQLGIVNHPFPQRKLLLIIIIILFALLLLVWGIQRMENINSSISQLSFVDLDVTRISFKGVSSGQFSNTTLYPDVTSSSSQVCEMQLNGNDFQPGTGIQAEGDYTLKATCIDDTGKSYEQTLLFTIDKTAPLVRILGVEDGKFFNQKVSIAIDVSDKNIDSSNIRLNDNDYESETEIVSDGDYKLKVEAVDKAGNATDETINFTIDRTEPEVKFVNVSENGIYNHKLIPRVSVIDEHLVKQTYHLNDEVFSLGTMIDGDGRYQLKVHAVDKAGNRSDPTVTFTIDQTPASIEVHGVEEGRFYGDDVKPLILIDGKEINDKHPGHTVLSLNGKVYRSGTAIVAEGNHVLHLVTRDEAGNEAEKTIKFGIIKSSPEIKVANVENGKSYKINVSPKIDIVTVSLDRKSILLNAKTYSSASLISAEGIYHLEIDAYDTVGNHTQKDLHFTIDKTAPAIEITGATSGGLYNNNLKPFVTFSDNNAVEDKQLLLNGAAFQSGTLITEDGSYTLQATGRDKAGNESTKLIMFEIDTVAPLIEINGIKDKAHYTSDVIPQITVRNFLDKTITLNGKEYYEGNHIKDDGVYTLTVTARDEAGNETTEVKSFVIDTQPPEIKITGIQNGSRYCEAVIPKINIVEDYNDNYSILLNGVPCKSQTPIVASDDYKLEVKVSDQAGNKVIQIVEFSINRKEPAILIDDYDPEEQLLKGHICNF